MTWDTERLSEAQAEGRRGIHGHDGHPGRADLQALVGTVWDEHVVAVSDVYRMVRERPRLYLDALEPAVLEAFVSGFCLARAMLGRPLSQGLPPFVLFRDWWMLELDAESACSVSELVQRHHGHGEDGVKALFEAVDRFAGLEVTRSLRGVVGPDAMMPEPPAAVVVRTLTTGSAWLSAEDDPTPIGPLRPSPAAVMCVAEHLYGIAPTDWVQVTP